MRIALFGGTFDPPHRGHLAVAQAAAARFALDNILFAPTGRQPLKPLGATASFADRLAMVALLCSTTDSPARLLASDIDAPRPDGLPNYTIDALAQLQRQARLTQTPSATEFFVMIGADAFLELRRWRNPDALLAAADWIVVSRPGFSLTDLSPLALSPQQRVRVHLLEGVAEPASATEIRRRLQAGMDCSDLLTAEVMDYIRKHRLYGSQGPAEPS